MRVLRLSLFFALFLPLNSYDLVIVAPAYADCCMCGSCGRGCSCPGVGGCPWCAAPASEQFQVKAAFSNPTTDRTSAGETVPSITINSQSIDRLIRLAGRRECGQNRLRLGITDGGNSLVVNQFSLEPYAMPENAVAVRIAHQQ
jgi:hypothetical protein